MRDLNALGCVWLGNLDLDFKIPISTLRSCWDICFGFPFLPFDWEIWKRIWKTVLKNSGLVHACIINKKNTLLLQILFRISQWNGKKEIQEIPIWISYLKSTLRTDFSEVKSVFGFRVRLQNLKSKFQNQHLDFPIERNPSSMYLDCCNHHTEHFASYIKLG